MDRGKLKIAIIALAAILVVLIIVAAILVLTDEKATYDTPPAEDTVETLPLPQDTEADERKEEELEKPSEEEQPSEQPSEQTSTAPSAVNPISPTTPTQPEQISFPYTIPGTSLVITKIDSYDGIFLEDGSDRSVTGICAMVLTNTGKTDVEYANITMTQDDRKLLFKATVLRSGCTVVVQESTAASYSAGDYEKCTADVAEADSLEMSSEQVKIQENADGSFTVTNLTDKTIGGIRVFYKFCITKGSVYVGGITYTAKVENLAPGVSQKVVPSHFSPGSSEVVMVRLYDAL